MRAAAPAFVLAALAMPGEVAAYIDPGTGSLVAQGLIAGFAAAAMLLRGYWYRIKALFRGDKDKAPPAHETRQPGDAE